MSQIQWNSQAVLAAADTHLQRHANYLKGVTDTVDQLGDVALLFAAAGGDKKDEQLQQLRTTVAQLLEARNRAQHCEAALQELRGSYQAGQELTDFEAELAQRTQQLAAAHPYNPAADPLMKEFEAAARGEAAPQEPEDEQIDDDIVVEGGQHRLAPNVTCPITTKPLLQIEDPVQDAMGVVYEKEAVVQFFRTLPPGKHGRAVIMAGSTHQVTLAELRPAEKVIKEKRRQARRLKLTGASQPPGTQAPAGGVAEDVLEV